MASPMFQNVSALGKLSFERSSFFNEKDHHKKAINNHCFNSSIQILMPESDIPRTVSDLLQGQVAFLTQRLPLHHLLDEEFIKDFIQEGTLCMLSQGTCIDVDDCIAVLPTGILLLSLTKETFQTLGLDGCPTTASKHSGKYVVKIDVLSKQFRPGTRSYKHVKWCLTKLPVMNFLVTWNPKDVRVCPTSVQNYFRSHSIPCNRLKIPQTTHIFCDLRVPVIDSQMFSPDNNQHYCGYQDMFEWLGACAIGIDSFDGDDYISSYSCPSPSQAVSHCAGSQYFGMFHPHTVQQTVESLRNYIRDKKIPWCSVTVHGFMDSPVAGQFDHGFNKSGDNLYTLLLFQNNDYWLYNAIGAFDTCP